MNKNIFFKKIKKISINEICKKLKIKNISKKNIYLNDINTLDDASKNDLTFLHLLLPHPNFKNIYPKKIYFWCIMSCLELQVSLNFFIPTH